MQSWCIVSDNEIKDMRMFIIESTLILISIKERSGFYGVTQCLRKVYDSSLILLSPRSSNFFEPIRILV